MVDPPTMVGSLSTLHCNLKKDQIWLPPLTTTTTDHHHHYHYHH